MTSPSLGDDLARLFRRAVRIISMIYRKLKVLIFYLQQIWTDAQRQGDNTMRFASGTIQRKNADNKAVKGSRAKRCSIIIIKDHEYEYDAKECSKGFKGVCMVCAAGGNCGNSTTTTEAPTTSTETSTTEAPSML